MTASSSNGTAWGTAAKLQLPPTFQSKELAPRVQTLSTAQELVDDKAQPKTNKQPMKRLPDRIRNIAMFTPHVMSLLCVDAANRRSGASRPSHERPVEKMSSASPSLQNDVSALVARTLQSNSLRAPSDQDDCELALAEYRVRLSW
jgi:hypothetical protein